MIYFLQPTEGGPVKVGFTDNLSARHKQLEAHYGRPWRSWPRWMAVGPRKPRSMLGSPICGSDGQSNSNPART